MDDGDGIFVDIVVLDVVECVSVEVVDVFGLVGFDDDVGECFIFFDDEYGIVLIGFSLVLINVSCKKRMRLVLYVSLMVMRMDSFCL